MKPVAARLTASAAACLRRLTVVEWVMLVVAGGLCVLVVTVGVSVYMHNREFSLPQCSATLKRVGNAMHIYAASNSLEFPPSLKVLEAAGHVSGEMLVCPARRREGAEVRYVYLAGLRADTAPWAVVTYEPVGTHAADGGYLLFADAHSEWLGAEEHAAAIARTRRYLEAAASRPASAKRVKP